MIVDYLPPKLRQFDHTLPRTPFGEASICKVALIAKGDQEGSLLDRAVSHGMTCNLPSLILRRPRQVRNPPDTWVSLAHDMSGLCSARSVR
jgi:hypothetical protein